MSTTRTIEQDYYQIPDDLLNQIRYELCLFPDSEFANFLNAWYDKLNQPGCVDGSNVPDFPENCTLNGGDCEPVKVAALLATGNRECVIQGIALWVLGEAILSDRLVGNRIIDAIFDVAYRLLAEELSTDG